MAVHDIAKIEEKIDRAAAGAVAISDTVGGVAFSNMSELLEFSKLMAIAGTAVPKHLRGNPGACLAVCVQALEWRFSPFSVANQSYEVNDRISYQAMLIHAVIEARAPLRNRLRFKFEGEGDEMRCVVTGHLKNEAEPVEYRSPPVGKITPKNSPLWRSDTPQQLSYFSARAWARRYCPDVILGVFAKDELEDSEIGADNARDITPRPDVGKRLTGSKNKRGFDAAHVERQTSSETAEQPTADAPAETVAATETTSTEGAVHGQQ